MATISSNGHSHQWVRFDDIERTHMLLEATHAPQTEPLALRPCVNLRRYSGHRPSSSWKPKYKNSSPADKYSLVPLADTPPPQVPDMTRPSTGAVRPWATRVLSTAAHDYAPVELRPSTSYSRAYYITNCEKHPRTLLTQRVAAHCASDRTVRVVAGSCSDKIISETGLHSTFLGHLRCPSAAPPRVADQGFVPSLVSDGQGIGRSSARAQHDAYHFVRARQKGLTPRSSLPASKSLPAIGGFAARKRKPFQLGGFCMHPW